MDEVEEGNNIVSMNELTRCIEILRDIVTRRLIELDSFSHYLVSRYRYHRIVVLVLVERDDVLTHFRGYIFAALLLSAWIDLPLPLRIVSKLFCVSKPTGLINNNPFNVNISNVSCKRKCWNKYRK